MNRRDFVKIVAGVYAAIAAPARMANPKRPDIVGGPSIDVEQTFRERYTAEVLRANRIASDAMVREFERAVVNGKSIVVDL